MNQKVNNETDLDIVDDTQTQAVSTGIFDLDLQAATSEERVEKAVQTTAVATSVIAQDTLERAGRSHKLEGALQLIAIGIAVVVLAIIAYLTYLVKDTLSLLVISFLIAYVLTPVVNIFERRGVNRTLVVAGLSVVILGIFILAALVVVNWATEQLTTFKTDLPKMAKKLEVKIAEGTPKLKKIIPQLESFASVMFSEDEFKDPNSLAVKLRNAKEPLSQYLRGQFSPGTRQLLDEYDGADTQCETLKAALVEELNQLLPEGGLYDEQRFAQITLTEETRKLAEQNPEGGALIHLNRSLLEEAYPLEIAKSQGLLEVIQEWVYSRIDNTISVVRSVSGKIMPIISMLVVVPFMTFFMLSGGGIAKKKFIGMVPNRYFEMTLVLINELDRQLGQYLRSRVSQTIILSALGIIGFAILRVRFWLFLGILAGVANIIPYFGPVLGAIPACIIALLDPPFGVWSVPLVIALTFLLQFIDNAIIFPLVVGKSVDLGPITTILVVLVGSQFFGLLGLLMAVPIAAMIKVAVQVINKEIKGTPEFG